MNLEYLFELQAALDTHIEKEHPRKPGESRLEQKILALLVEVGECANEYRGFKFWSNDKQPRQEKLLEEYVDCLHFVLSIGLDMDIKSIKEFQFISNFDEGCTIAFLEFYNAINQFYNFQTKQYYYDVIRCFIILGRELGFTEQQIESAYDKKNKINHQRQLTGY